MHWGWTSTRFPIDICIKFGWFGGLIVFDRKGFGTWYLCIYTVCVQQHRDNLKVMPADRHGNNK